MLLRMRWNSAYLCNTLVSCGRSVRIFIVEVIITASLLFCFCPAHIRSRVSLSVKSIRESFRYIEILFWWRSSIQRRFLCYKLIWGDFTAQSLGVIIATVRSLCRSSSVWSPNCHWHDAGQPSHPRWSHESCDQTGVYHSQLGCKNTPL